MMQPLMLDGIAEGARNGLLAGYFVEGLRAPLARDHVIGHLEMDGGCFLKLARPRTFPQHTLPLLPLLRSRPGGVHKASVVRSPGSDNSIGDTVKSLFFDARTFAANR